MLRRAKISIDSKALVPARLMKLQLWRSPGESYRQNVEEEARRQNRAVRCKEDGRRRGWIKVIKQAIWRVGHKVFRSRTRQARKTSERSPPAAAAAAAAHHKISPGKQGNEGDERRTDSEGRQSSYRATESGARERKGNGLHARSPPGAHDHIAEGPSSRSKPGGGHWPLAIGCGIAGSQNVAGRVLGPRCLRTLYSESRPALQAHPAVRARHSENQQREHSV